MGNIAFRLFHEEVVNEAIKRFITLSHRVTSILNMS